MRTSRDTAEKTLEQQVTRFLVWQWVRLGLSAQQVAKQLRVGREEPLDRDSRGDCTDYGRRAVNQVRRYLEGDTEAYGSRSERGELAFALLRAGAFACLTPRVAWFDPVVRRALLPVASLIANASEDHPLSVDTLREHEAGWIEAVSAAGASLRTNRRDFVERINRLADRLEELASVISLSPEFACASPLIHPALGQHDRLIELYGAGQGVHKVHVPPECSFPFAALDIPPQPLWLTGSSARDRVYERVVGALDVLQRLTLPQDESASTMRAISRLVSITKSLMMARYRDMDSVIAQEAWRLGAGHGSDEEMTSPAINWVDWDADDGMYDADTAARVARSLHGDQLQMTFEQEQAGVFAHCASAQPIVYPCPGLPEHKRIAALLTHVAAALRTVKPVIDRSMCRDLPGSLESFGMADFKDHADSRRREAIYTTQNSQCCTSSLEEIKAALYPPCKRCIARLANSPWFELERA